MAEPDTARVPIHDRKASVSFRDDMNLELVRVDIVGVMVTTVTHITARCTWCKELFIQASIERLKDHARQHADNGDDYKDEQDPEEVPF